MSRHNLNDAINRAVRDVMDVDADATFGARLRARTGRPAPASRWRRLAVAAGILLALGLSVLLLRTPGPHGNEPAVSAVPPQLGGVPVTQRADLPAQARDRANEAAGAPAPPRHALSRAPTMPSLRPTSTDDRPGGTAVGVGEPLEIEALTPIEPIVVAPLHTRAIVPEEIVMPPLSPITDVHIEPLSLP